MRSLRVAVAGGGLGGLALARGLLRTGADVTVYERDASLVTRRQGYRLHLDARAGLALDALLPPESFALFAATGCRSGYTAGWSTVADGNGPPRSLHATSLNRSLMRLPL
jgi:2-polyprenyl-6-methoxyphenol hydroxylase-like FAD-dependent oxidoreductase